MQHRQRLHDALPLPSHDESARQDFVSSLRQYSARTVGAVNYKLYKARIEPAFEAEHGRLPRDSEEVRPLMTSDPYYQFWSATQRNSQEMIWDSVIDTVERRRPELLEKIAEPQRLGSLRLNPDMDVPRYHSAYDIHLQPGGYHTEQGDQDVAAGAIYDLGVPLYALGMMGQENNSTGDTLVNFYRNAYPDADPERILDLGCAIGNSTVPWAKAYPDAEVHGIDVGAPCLRYGHMRANALEVGVHLSQQNAEATDFPDNHFDVIASALLFHETSNTAVPRIFAECLRILKPGGVMIHFDGFHTTALEPVMEFLHQWEVYNNNEHFLAALRKIDVIDLCKSVGFSSVEFSASPYVTDLPPRSGSTKNDKGYMTGSFGTVPLLIGIK